jgi:hypothetical protein
MFPCLHSRVVWNDRIDTDDFADDYYKGNSLYLRVKGECKDCASEVVLTFVKE